MIKRNKELSVGTDKNLPKDLLFILLMLLSHVRKGFKENLEKFDHDSEYQKAALMYTNLMKFKSLHSIFFYKI